MKHKKERKLKIGDRVRLKSKKTKNLVPPMEKYLGKVVTVSELHKYSSKGEQKFYTQECPTWIWNKSDIEDFIPDEVPVIYKRTIKHRKGYDGSYIAWFEPNNSEDNRLYIVTDGRKVSAVPQTSKKLVELKDLGALFIEENEEMFNPSTKAKTQPEEELSEKTLKHTNSKALSREKEKGHEMEDTVINLNNVHDAEDFDYDEQVVTTADATIYAEKVASEAILAYAAQLESEPIIGDTKGNETMTTIKQTGEAILAETQGAAALIAGEVLLENIETAAEKLVFTQIGFFKRLLMSSKQKELLIAIATYGIIYAVKTGGFGLTKYRIEHTALDYITLAANQKILKTIIKGLGVNTNVAETLMSMPVISKDA